MPKKIYDIIPSEKIEEKECFCSKKKPQSKRPFVFSSIFVALVLLGVFFFVQGKAEVRIYPNVEEVSVEASVVIETVESLINYETNTLPGVIFSDKRIVQEEYFSTGSDSKTKRATGTIRVYNKIAPAKKQALVKNTRFLSSPEALVYRADEAFTIPANGYVDIAVTAEEAGTKYNISSTNFSVPGLVGTEIYSSIWAETISSLEGGEDSEIKVVTADDISSSKEEFEEYFKKEAKQILIESIPESIMLIEEIINQEMKDLYSNAQPGAEAEKFIISGEIESKVIAFREEDLLKLGESLINEDLSDIQKIVPDSVLCEIEEHKDNDGKIELKVIFNAKTYFLSEEQELKNILLNSKKINSVSLLENMSEINKVEIDTFPFWQFSLPSKESNINIILKFN